MLQRSWDVARLVGLARADVDQHGLAAIATSASASASGHRPRRPGPSRSGQTTQPASREGHRRKHRPSAIHRAIHRSIAGTADWPSPAVCSTLGETAMLDIQTIRDQFPITRQRFQVLGSVGAQAAHLPGPRGEHPPADARARHLQGLPRALLRQRPPRPALPLGDGDRSLRARLGRHLPLHRGQPRRQHGDPVREHDAGPRPRLPRDGAPRGRDARLADGAPLERPAAPRARARSSTSASRTTARSTTTTSRRSSGAAR